MVYSLFVRFPGAVIDGGLLGALYRRCVGISHCGDLTNHCLCQSLGLYDTGLVAYVQSARPPRALFRSERRTPSFDNLNEDECSFTSYILRLLRRSRKGVYMTAHGVFLYSRSRTCSVVISYHCETSLLYPKDRLAHWRYCPSPHPLLYPFHV